MNSFCEAQLLFLMNHLSQYSYGPYYTYIHEKIYTQFYTHILVTSDVNNQGYGNYYFLWLKAVNMRSFIMCEFSYLG